MRIIYCLAKGEFIREGVAVSKDCMEYRNLEVLVTTKPGYIEEELNQKWHSSKYGLRSMKMRHLGIYTTVQLAFGIQARLQT